MATQVLNLPVNIPWKLVAVSEDMMDTQFCDKLFPFEWRSSLAMSIFEPKKEDLPEDLCDDRITYVKVTCTVTGYVPSKEETARAYRDFSYPSPQEGREQLFGRLERVLSDYFACYGVLLNVAVFPFLTTRQQLGPIMLNFSQEDPGDRPNPYSIDNLTFQATDQANNRIVERPLANENMRVLDLQTEMNITIPRTPKVRARVVNFASAITMEAYHDQHLVGSRTTGDIPGKVEELEIEGPEINRVVFKSPHNKSFLLEFTYFEPQDVPTALKDYPHIIDFTPKTRDLYQAATENGEVLTASNSEVKTDKTFSQTETSELGITGSVTASYAQAGFSGSLTGGLTKKWGETNQDSYQVQSDASRDRRERNATTTNITQMYNLLTGYHAGTNRAVFLMLPRPNNLQPTDRRTFIQGLRYIEGVQDFFLIVARSNDIRGLSIEAFLQTGHFPEKVDLCEPEVEYDETYEDFVVTAESGEDKFSAIEKFVTSNYTIQSGWVVDRRIKRMGDRANPNSNGWDPGHPGIKDLDAQPNDLAAKTGTLTFPAGGYEPPSVTLFNYQPISDSTVQVSGRIGTDNGVKHLARNFRVFTRSEQPKPSSAAGSVCSLDRLIITGRTLCGSFTSGDCPEVIDTEHPPVSSQGFILNEQIVQIAPALLTREETAPTRLTTAKFMQKDGTEQLVEVSPTLLTTEPSRLTRLPAMKELLRKIQFAITRTGSSPSSVPIGAVGFLESDYFKDQMKPVLLPVVLNLPVASVANLPTEVVNAFSGKTVADALVPNLASFARMTGLDVADAAKARYLILTARPPVVG